MPVILADEKQAKRFTDRIVNSDSTVRKWFEGIIEKIRSILKKAYDALKREKSWEQMEVVRTRQESIDIIAELYFDALESTKGKSAERNIIKDTAQQGTIRYSRKSSESKSIKEQIREHISELAAMSTVGEYSIERIAGLSKEGIKQEVYKAFGDNFSIDKRGYGTVVLGKNQISNGINHIDFINHPEEAAAIFAVPKVIKNGIKIGEDTNHDGVKQKTITFAAPVIMKQGSEDSRVNVGVVVIEERKNYYHAHRVLMPDGSVIQLNKKAGTQVAVASAAKADVVARTVPANKNVPESFNNVKYSYKDTAEQNAIAEFGTTYSWNETGYITPNGKQLDFSGKRDGARGGSRSMDHREVSSLYESEDLSGSEAMVRFMGEGNIRISPESGGINLQSAPTTAQAAKLESFINKNSGEVIVDLDNANGETLHSIEYPEGSKATKILNDIRKYYSDGTVPTVSETQKYFFSRKDGTPATGKDVQELQRHNDSLKKQLAIAKQEIKLSGGHKIKPTVIDSLAGKLAKEYSSSIDKADLAAQITELYNYIGDGSNVSADDMQAAAMNVAYNILDKSSNRDTTKYDEAKPVREYLKNTAIKLNDGQIKGVEYYFGSM